jgi:hypothetical protein
MEIQRHCRARYRAQRATATVGKLAGHLLSFNLPREHLTSA